MKVLRVYRGREHREHITLYMELTEDETTLPLTEVNPVVLGLTEQQLLGLRDDVAAAIAEDAP